MELLDPTGELLDGVSAERRGARRVRRVAVAASAVAAAPTRGLAEARRADLAEATGGHEAVLFSLEELFRNRAKQRRGSGR